MMVTLGGSSAIAAHNLAALGSRVGFQSRIGDDQLGQIALDRLSEGGVDTSMLRRISGKSKTGLTVILQRNGWRNMLTYSGTIAELNISDLEIDYLADSRHFHLCALFLQTALRPDVPSLFKQLKSAGLTISLDTNDDPADRWEGLEEILPFVDVFLPNAREARQIARTDDLPLAVSRLAKIVPLVVVKLGQDGAMAQRGEEQATSPAIKLSSIDAVGAGDSFDAGFLHAYVGGADLEACLRAGNLAGALSTTRPGGTEAFRDRAHREQFLAQHAQPAYLEP
jgi:sugar/nucleoside kinase (ribokinase family)